jgi:hypothetical protein
MYCGAPIGVLSVTMSAQPYTVPTARLASDCSVGSTPYRVCSGTASGLPNTKYSVMAPRTVVIAPMRNTDVRMPVAAPSTSPPSPASRKPYPPNDGSNPMTPSIASTSMTAMSAQVRPVGQRRPRRSAGRPVGAVPAGEAGVGSVVVTA